MFLNMHIGIGLGYIHHHTNITKRDQGKKKGGGGVNSTGIMFYLGIKTRE